MINIGSKIKYQNKIWEVIDNRKEGFYLRNADEIQIFSRMDMNINIDEGVFILMNPLIQYTVDDLKNKILKGDFKDDLYSSTNEDGEDIMITITKDYLQITTFQKNGWVRNDTYEYEDNWSYSESYEGKWK